MQRFGCGGVREAVEFPGPPPNGVHTEFDADLIVLIRTMLRGQDQIIRCRWLVAKGEAKSDPHEQSKLSLSRFLHYERILIDEAG